MNVHGPAGQTRGLVEPADAARRSRFAHAGSVLKRKTRPMPCISNGMPQRRSSAFSANWRMKQNRIQIGTSTKPSYTDSTIEYGKTYQYYVQSVEKTNDTYAESEISEAIKPSSRRILSRPQCRRDSRRSPGTRSYRAGVGAEYGKGFRELPDLSRRAEDCRGSDGSGVQRQRCEAGHEIRIPGERARYRGK